ncbi:amino acid adenylation domain-containing protein [Candidatus Nitrospira bockiana]
MSQPVASPTHIESIYPLSPMQEGMLFHTLLNPGSGMYLMQNRYVLEGEVDSEAFARAWRRVAERHPILRTSFAWKSQKQPLQVVHKDVELPVEVLDWRGKAGPEQDEEVQALLRAELAEGFDFNKAPLTRIRLIRLAEKTYEFIHSFHHILLDEWCTSLLMMDFLAHYEAFAQGRPLALPMPRPYRDYITWLQRQDLGTTERFWRAYLKGVTAPTPLVFEERLGGIADQGAEIGDETGSLDAESTSALVALAQRHQLTLNTLVQAAWALLLSHYSGESDVLFGVTVAGRPPELPEVESIVGLFINTLPLRLEVRPERPLLPWLKEVLAENIRIRRYEYTPLLQVQEWSELRRGQGLFQSLFVFENAPIDPALRDGRIVFKVRDVQYRVHTNYPMTVVAWPGPELGLKLSYDVRAFHADSVARMLGHLKTLLGGMARHPDARLGDLPLLTEAEHQQLVAWNETKPIFPPRSTDLPALSTQCSALSTASLCYPQLFEAQVRRTPDAVAVIHQPSALSLHSALRTPRSTLGGDTRLTYRQLNARANRVARALAAEGVGPETVVALLDERGVDFLTMVLAVFKAGGAYLPLDPKHPAARIAHLLTLSRAPVLLCTSGFNERAAEAVGLVSSDRPPRVLSIETILEDGWPDTDLPAQGGPRHLAYVIYTSGSTGIPKGAMVEHRGMLNNMVSKIPVLGLTADDVIAQTASQCFDISVWQFLTAFLVGGCVSIVPDEIAHDPSRLLTFVDAAGLTVLETVPAMMQGLLDASGDASRPSLMGLRWLLPTGEALPPVVCRRWQAAFPSVRLLNAYGPAECSDDVALHPIEPALPEDATSVPIGRPVDNLRLYVLNRMLQPVPVGVPGELCVAGVGVGRGYLNDPARTAEVFVPDPFGKEPGGRLYRTGDLARSRPDGILEFLGRLDHQVKIHGFRIELGEIEAHLGAHPSVRDTVVLAREDRPGEKRLVAYVVPSEEAPWAPDTLRAFLAERLPAYMVPAVFTALPVLPRTPNGKLDRKALPAPEPKVPGRAAGPQTATEELVAGIWAEVLGVDRVGRHEDFFELGGHSLRATQVMARVRTVFGIELPLRTLFESPTVADLAKAVDAARLDGAGVQGPPLLPVVRTGPVPLSFAQQRLWFLSQLEPDSAFYHIPAALRVTGPLDPSALERSFNGLVARHDVLRTTFAIQEGEPVQVIAPEQEVRLFRVDLSLLPEVEREAAARRLAREEGQRPFDLTNGPLLRAGVLRLGELDHVLLVTLHHSIADGWSMNVLIHDVATLYTSDLAGRPVSLPALPIQYADYAQWQRRWLEGPVREAQLAYWRRRLAGAPPVLELPADRPRPAVQSYRGARHAFVVPTSLAQALAALSRRQGATLFMTLLSAFQVLVFRYTGQTDLCIGTPVANRTRAEVEGLIGFFVNTLVLRTDLAGNPRATELLARVREAVLGAQAHQDLPFEQLVEALEPARDLSHSPLFQVMFALQTPPEQTVAIPGVQVDVMEVDPGSAKFDLSLEMTAEAEELTGFFEYSTDLFDERTIRQMEAHFQRVLQAIVANPEVRIADVPLLSEPEQHQLLVEWNSSAVLSTQHSPLSTSEDASELSTQHSPLSTSEDASELSTQHPALSTSEDASELSTQHSALGTHLCLHDLVAAQAARTPDSVAVVRSGQTLSYQELDARANRLARYLRRHGVGPESLVGLCVERSLDMVVGVLAILKAGAAYVPIDPTYPRERMLYMLDDAQVSVLLTQERLLGVLPQRAGRCLCIDRDWPEIAEQEGGALAVLHHPSHAAYVIYTSGSTGRPKGVVITHGSAVTLVQWAHTVYRPEDLRGMLASTSLCFDLSVFELFVPLSCGGRVIIADHALELPALPEAEEVTLINTVPSAIAELLRQQAIPRSVRTVNLAGEALKPALVDQLYALEHIERVFDLYGPSEDTTYSTYALRRAGGPATIGRPIAKTQAYVLDQRLTPVPVGVPGELFIGGAGLARGYWKRPDLTAEKFLPSPFGPTPGSRLYRTGDLVRYRPDGTLEFLGRMDHQIKLRGFRIELGEIEAHLLRHPDVREAVVLLREDRPGEKRLVAYVVPQPGATPASDALRRVLSEQLPEYMVPSVCVSLPALPLTPNGKLDRRALPAPEVDAQRERSYVPPRSAAEALLARTWADVLGLERVGVLDNFFELGGDSILGLQVIARAKQAGLVLTPRQLFQHQTIAELAAAAGELGAAVKERPGVRAGQGVVTGEVPLTPIQHWFFEQELPNPHHWNQAVLLELTEPVEPPALEAALGHLVQHHDALRMEFVREGEGWRQINRADAPASLLTVVDLSSHAPDAQPLTLEAIASEWQARLHLKDGPLLRGVLFELGDGRSSRLLLTVHHLVVDGVSWRILIEDLRTAYQQQMRGQAVSLPAKTTSFKQWAERIRLHARSEALRQEAGYWLDPRRSAVAPVPVDEPRGDRTEAALENVTGSLSEADTRALLHEVPDAYHTRIDEVLLTALAQALGTWMGSPTVLVDVEGHGREDLFPELDVSRTVGWFTSICPVLLEMPPDCPPAEALKTIKEQLRKVPHRGIGYGMLRYLDGAGQVADQLRAQPAAQICFNYLGQLDQALPERGWCAPARESVGREHDPRSPLRYELDISAEVQEGRLEVTWSYSRERYRRATIDAVSRRYLQCLRALIAHCLSPEAGGYTPADFPDIDIEQEALDTILESMD